MRYPRNGEFAYTDVELVGHETDSFRHVIHGKVFTAQTQEVLRAARDNNFTFFYRGEADNVSDEITPCSGARREKEGILFPFLNLVDEQRFRIRPDLALAVKVLFLKGDELVKDSVVRHKAHRPPVRVCLEGNKSFRGEISLDVVNWPAKQVSKSLAIRLERHSPVHIHFEVGPYFVNVRHAVVVDDFLHQALYPRRDTDDDPNVPVDSLTRDFIEFRIPIARLRNLFSGLIKVLKPERQSCCLDAAQVAFKVAAPVVQVCTPTQHENARFEDVCRKVILGERKNLSDACLLNRL